MAKIRLTLTISTNAPMNHAERPLLVTKAVVMAATSIITTAPGTQSGERDDQFRQIPQRGVEQPAHRIARLGRHGFSGVTEQRRQGHNGQDRQHEEQRMRLVPELLRGKHDRNEGQQPEPRIVPDFVEQVFHAELGLGDSCDE